ncbi:ECA polysaccharide chain length modulation protein [Pantoea sp. Mb-10]|uniref:ECA polysaccharide chain length modulation protein n=1 Tax=unclassified Pantoea TaxID=2630326 RepID=UPI001E4C1D44|nr:MULTISPECIES: ECA polysaccharide chain length modulation protein [unclassified Pantoea]MCE0491671.1 ECA polysaccharide chain length modulation protein [Pantoea sp. Mb-10]MCE0502858.1 ECA polysaccharide chain length modulation protein [Pantoea sp. Pb-8]
MTSVVVENELDVRGLGCTLWRGKRWIIGFALLFALLAWLASMLMKQAWSTTAVTDRPTVNMLGDFFVQQQFLNNLDMRTNTLNLSTPAPTVMDEVYQELTMQLASWDTRRDFWQQTDYYKSRKSGNAHNDAALLDDLINNIQYTPADAAHNVRDTIKLVAETASDANNLLRQYVAYASERAARHLNAELQGAWQARSEQLQAQVKRQQEVAQAVFDRQRQRIEQALSVASQQGIEENRAPVSGDALPDSDRFLLGQRMLRAQLETLQASGPAYDLSYDQNRAMLSTLQAGPRLDKQFQTYRYLRTPEEPVSRDSPRRLFMMVMWGVIGALFGAGVALARRPRAASTPSH